MKTIIKKTIDKQSIINIAKQNPHYFNDAGINLIKKGLEGKPLLFGSFLNNKMVAFIVFKELNDQVVELVWMAVVPKYQDQSIGTLLVKEGIKLLPKNMFYVRRKHYQKQTLTQDIPEQEIFIRS